MFSCSSAEAVCWINRKTGEKVSQGQSQSNQLKRGIISHDSKIPESGAESRGCILNGADEDNSKLKIYLTYCLYAANKVVFSSCI